MKSITRFITKKLKLTVNEGKSAVARPQERKFLGFSFSAGPEVKRVIPPKALDRFKQRIREITRRAKRRQHRDDDRGVDPVYAGLAQLFRLLRDAASADLPHPLGPTATSGGSVAAVENTAPSPGRPDRAGGSAAAGQQHRRQRSRSLVSGPGEGSLCGAFQCLQMPTSNHSDFQPSPLGVSVTNSNRRVRTRTHGGVAGVGG